MSRNVLIAISLLCAFGAWRHFSSKADSTHQSPGDSYTSIASSKDTVLVYGRDSCAYTRQTLASLRDNEIPVTYINIDYADANKDFHEKFGKTGLDGGRGYALPVVDLAGQYSMRPNPDGVARQFRSMH